MQIFPYFCYEKMVIKSSDVQELNTATSLYYHVTKNAKILTKCHFENFRLKIQNR